MTLNAYKESQNKIITIKKTIDYINKEIRKLPKEFSKNYLQKLYILGNDVLVYPNNTKNGIYRTHDAIIIQRPFPFFSYKCYIKWGCTFRKNWFGVNDIRLYNQDIKLSKLDINSLERLTVALTKVLDELILENKGNECKH